MTPHPAQPVPTALQRWRSTERALRVLLPALAAFLLLLFLYSAARRLRYPFELEWVESGMLTSVLRLVHGQGLYVAPTLHFVPYLYAPLFFYLSAALTKLTGIGSDSYTALRLISIASTLGTCAIIFAFVRSESHNRLASIAAAGLYAGSYVLAGTFFDIGRVDALFVFTLLLSLYTQRRGNILLAALFWTLTFQTKQSALPLAVLILLAEWPRPRRLLTGLGAFAVFSGSSVLLLNHLTGGYYGFYVFGVTRALGILPRQAILYIPQTVLQPMPVAWVTIVAGTLFPTLPRRSTATLFFSVVSFAIFAGIWFVESHKGASANAIMPVYAWTAVLFGLAAARLLNGSTASEALAPHLPAPRTRVLVLLALIIQLVSLIYNPGAYLPSALAYRAGADFLAQLRSLPGDVYILNHGHDGELAGKPSFAEGEALGAVIDAHLGNLSADLRRQFNEALQSGRYSAFVVDDPEPFNTSWHAERFYPNAIAAPAFSGKFLTSQPQWFLLPCAPPLAVTAVLRAHPVLVYEGACNPGTTTAKP